MTHALRKRCSTNWATSANQNYYNQSYEMKFVLGFKVPSFCKRGLACLPAGRGELVVLSNSPSSPLKKRGNSFIDFVTQTIIPLSMSFGHKCALGYLPNRLLWVYNPIINLTRLIFCSAMNINKVDIMLQTNGLKHTLIQFVSKISQALTEPKKKIGRASCRERV